MALYILSSVTLYSEKSPFSAGCLEITYSKPNFLHASTADRTQSSRLSVSTLYVKFALITIGDAGL